MPSAAMRMEAVRRRIAERISARGCIETRERVAASDGVADAAAGGGGKQSAGLGGRHCHVGDGRTATMPRIADGDSRSDENGAERLVYMQAAAAAASAHGNLGAEEGDSNEEYKIHQGAEVEASGCSLRPQVLATVETAATAAAAAAAWHARVRPRAADGGNRLNAR